MRPTRITAFYYHRYGNKDEPPADPSNAADTVTVEVGGPESTIDSFWATYHFVVVTREYLRRCPDLLGGKDYRIFRSLIVVETFDDATIERALEHMLPTIEKYGFPENEGLPGPPPLSSADPSWWA